jgi:two-component system cell cycle response regulator
MLIKTGGQHEARNLKGLDSGADDFLTKPVDDKALLARVRSLVRLKAVTDELRMRAMTSKDYGFGDPLAAATSETGTNGRVLIVDDRISSTERLTAALKSQQQVAVETNPHHAIIRATEENYDCVIVSLDLNDFDALRLCSHLRSLERTRNVAVLMIAEPEDKARILRGLEIGAHDFLVRPVDRSELVARVRTQVRRKRFSEKLRDSVQASMELAVTDSLTGLHNRRYLDSHMTTMFDESALRARSLSVLVLDIDKFKGINDTYGHDAGDEVLREFANRVKANTRSFDVVARFGGEEVVVIVPDTHLQGAMAIAERIREEVEAKPFMIQNGRKAIHVTVSIGVAGRRAGDPSAQEMLKRADMALYQAKQEGRNRVIPEAA